MFVCAMHRFSSEYSEVVSKEADSSRLLDFFFSFFIACADADRGGDRNHHLRPVHFQGCPRTAISLNRFQEDAGSRILSPVAKLRDVGRVVVRFTNLCSRYIIRKISIPRLCYHAVR